MINILQVVPVLSYGGIEKIIQNYYSAIDHNQFHFDYVSHGTFIDYNQQILDGGSQIFFLPTIGKVGFSVYKTQIKSNINLEDYDIVHIHTGDITGLYAKAYKKAGAKKIICHAHTAHYMSQLARIAKIYFKYLALKYSDFRLSCGILAGNYCFGKNNYTLLPNSIEYKKFLEVSDIEKNQLKSELSIPENSIILGHVGSFCRQKNHLFLIQVFNKLLQINSNYVLILVGDGPDIEKYKNYAKRFDIEKSVYFLGNRNDVNVLMNIFDLFIFPSLYEGLPVVGVEAQASGTKCILSDEIDRTVDLGIGLVDFLPIHNGTDIWVKKIEESLYEKKKVPSEIEIVKAIIQNGYDSEISVDNLSNIYKSLC